MARQRTPEPGARPPRPAPHAWTSSAWGRLELDDERLVLHVLGGDLRLDTVTARGVRLEPMAGGAARAGESLTFVVPA